MTIFATPRASRLVLAFLALALTCAAAVPLACQTPAPARPLPRHGARQGGGRPAGHLQSRDLQHPGPGRPAQARHPRHPEPRRRRRLPYEAGRRFRRQPEVRRGERARLVQVPSDRGRDQRAGPLQEERPHARARAHPEEDRRRHLLRRARHPGLGLRREDEPADGDHRSVPPLPRGVGRCSNSSAGPRTRNSSPCSRPAPTSPCWASAWDSKR